MVIVLCIATRSILNNSCCVCGISNQEQESSQEYSGAPEQSTYSYSGSKGTSVYSSFPENLRRIFQCYGLPVLLALEYYSGNENDSTIYIAYLRVVSSRHLHVFKVFCDSIKVFCDSNCVSTSMSIITRSTVVGTVSRQYYANWFFFFSPVVPCLPMRIISILYFRESPPVRLFRYLF